MMKKHNALKVVLITLVVFVLLTWILPTAYFQTEYVSQDRIQMGIFDLFTYPVTAVSYFGYIALYVLAVGGFYGILGKTGAYRNLLDKMVSKFKGKEKIVLSVIMVLLAVLTSVCGLDLALLFFFPMIISLVLLMGYDKVTAALVTVGSVLIGLAGATCAYNLQGAINAALALKSTVELPSKIVILVLGLVILIFNVLKREKVNTKTKAVVKKETKKTTTKAAKKEEEKVVVKETKVETEEGFVPAVGNKKAKSWPLVVMLSFISIIMILAFISWQGMFELSSFETAATKVTEFKVFSFPIFGKLLGTFNAFGNWSVSDLITVLFISSFVIALIYRISFDEYVDGFVKGAKKALFAAVIIVLIYTCLVIVTYHPFQMTIYNAILGLTKGFNVFTTSITAILAAVFNVDPMYAFQSVLPYLSSLITDKSVYPVIAIIFQSLYALVMLIAPTSVILMAVLSYLKISYKDWFKNVWKIVLEFLVVLIIIFTILVLI